MRKFIDFRKKKSIIRLIIIIYATIFILYTSGIAIAITSQVNTRNRIINSINSQVNYYITVFETDIVKTLEMQKEYLNDQNLTELSFKHSILNYYQRFILMKNISKRLQYLTKISDNISSVKVYIPAINKIISTSEKIYNAEDDKNLIDISHKNSLGQPSPILYYNDKFFLNLTYPWNSIQMGKDILLYNICIELEEEKIIKQLNSFIKFKDSSVFLYSPNSQWTISTDNRAELKDVLNFQGIKQKIVGSRGIISTNYNHEKYLLVYGYSALLDINLMVLFPESDVMSPLKIYYYIFWILTLTMLGIVIMVLIQTNRIVAKPVTQLLEAFERVKNGDLKTTIQHNRDDEFGQLYFKFNYMLSELNNYIEQAYQKTILSQRSKLKQLQSQIMPHFLFNSLFMIKRMAADGETQKVYEFANYLAKYYEYITKTQLDDVKLSDEYNHVRNYLEIQKMRFGNRISVELDEVPGHLTDLKVPKLILQPNIENIFKHGLNNTIYNGIIRISFKADSNKLDITVEDNGNIIDDNLDMVHKLLNSEDCDDQHVGILNVHNRLKIKYGNNSGIEVSRSELGGLKVNMSIPIYND